VGSRKLNCIHSSPIAADADILKWLLMFDFDVPKRLLAQIARFERDDLLIKLAGLSLDPLYQDNHLRIFTLVQLVLARAKGQKRASALDLSSMLNALLDHDSGRCEDPAEDVFVASITHPALGDLYIFLGIFTANDCHLQRMLNAFLDTAADVDAILAPCEALLRLGDAVARACGLIPGQFTTGQLHRKSWPRVLPALVERGRKACFSGQEIEELEIDPTLLEPFVLLEPQALLELRCGENAMMAQPIVRTGKGLCLPVPSLISPAIRLYLAQAMAWDRALARSVTEHLQTGLFGRWLIYDFPIRGHRPLRTEEIALDEPKFEMFRDYAHAVLRVDEDKAAHLICLSADWSEPPAYALYAMRDSPPHFTPNLNRYILHCIKQLRPRFARGLTIVTYDSPGWNVDFRVQTNPGGNWYVVALPSHALELLLSDPHFDLIALWKMMRALRLMRESGLLVALYPDLINFWAFWQQLGGSFRVPGIDLDAFGALISDTRAIQPWVAASRSFRGAHSVLAADGSWERVERYLRPDAPPEEMAKPLYFQPMAIVSETLRNVTERQGQAWWVSTARPPFSLEEKQYLFLLWQTASEWAVRMLANPANPLAARLPCFELRLLPVPEEIPDAPNTFEIVRAEDYPVVTLVIPPGFIETMATPGNEGEAALVGEIAQAAILASDMPVSEADRSAWVEAVTADPALKMMHVTYSADLGLGVDLVSERLGFRPLAHSDLMDSARNARAMLRAEQLPDELIATDRPTITRLLNAIVDARWQRCRALLGELDRTQTLVLVMRQIEAALRERASDARSALARTRLYVGEDSRGWTIARISERDAAFRSYRVVAEMALCACPLEGGRTPGLTDLDAIAAEIFQLVANAEYSDAVRRELVPGRLDFLPDGGLGADTGGATVAMPDYLRASLQEVVDDDVESYADHFDAPETEDAPPPNDKPYLIAFEAEFGISVFESMQVSMALQTLCLAERSHVVRLRRSDILARCAETNPAIDADQFDRFVRAFGLITRPAWDVPADGFDTSDVWPWLFERRLSLMLRPVLVTGTGDDPLLIYGVRQLDLSMHYVSHLLENGVWLSDRLRSEEAKRFVYDVVAKRSDDFEAQIADLARSAGWQVFPNLFMKRLGAPKALGEIDLLAVHEPSGIWVVVECKWFGAARTAREVMNWMQDFHGKGGDKLDHHLQRAAWVSTNKAQAAQRLKLAEPRLVLGRIVTTRPVPLAFSSRLPAGADTLTKRQFVASLATGASAD
jgi:hypothetical protein